VAAFAAYRRLFDPAARLSIVGGRTLLLYARALERLAAELEVADAVDFTDNLTFPQLVAHYRAADVFVSLSEHEGFCVPLVEAMHFGVPTVAHACCAVPETVGDATVLLDDKDPLTVAVAVQRVLSDDAVRKAMIEAGHGRVEHFSLVNNQRRLLDALEPRIAAADG
jgi:glycosyltransferase involved in cell wall biosynthesis